METRTAFGAICARSPVVARVQAELVAKVQMRSLCSRVIDWYPAPPPTLLKRRFYGVIERLLHLFVSTVHLLMYGGPCAMRNIDYVW
jgi:hypothetical protein